MKILKEYFVFSLVERLYALHLDIVEKVLHMVEITPLPDAPEIVLGVINIQGRIVPVVDIRKRFHLPEREIDTGDHLIVARAMNRPVALVADKAIGVVARREHDITPGETLLPHMAYTEGVAKFEDGMILIHDLDRFLSLSELEHLDQALSGLREEVP